MLIPIRCFSCGKVLGNKWYPFLRLLRNGVTLTKDMTKRNLNQEGAALDVLGIKRLCCRAIMLTTVDMVDKLFTYDYGEAPERKSQNYSTS